MPFNPTRIELSFADAPELALRSPSSARELPIPQRPPPDERSSIVPRSRTSDARSEGSIVPPPLSRRERSIDSTCRTPAG